jgi:glycosyltransferase involved in cell wall biosynthesis
MSVDQNEAVETRGLQDIEKRVLSQGGGKKILFVTNTNQYGGAEKHLLELIRRLCGPGIRISILCLQDNFLKERLSPDCGVETFTCDKLLASVQDWADLFRAGHFDVVVFVYGWFWALPWMAAVGAWKAGIPRRFSIQHLLTPPWPVPYEVSAQIYAWKSFRRRLARLRGREPREQPLWMRKQPLCVMASLSTPFELKLSAYFCKKTICVSDALRNSIISDFGFPARKMKTIHNGISLSEFIPSKDGGSEVRGRLGIHQDDFVLVCVARLGEQKGIDVLLKAIANVLHNNLSCKCIIVGDGPLRDEMSGLAQELGLSGHVFFEGFSEDVRPYLQAGSAFILTSHMEGLPLSILEAMACGLPCIVTDVGGNSEIITHRVHGLIVSRGSAEAAADAISYLVTHPTECSEMARMARKRVCEAFDIEKSMAEIRRLLLS